MTKDLTQFKEVETLKLQGELKERLAGARAMHLRTHGGNLRANPAQHMQMRVHELFSSDRLHETQGLSSRERRFLSENGEGGYVDTVENAIAARPQERIHWAKRTHRAEYDVATGVGRLGGVGQSGLSAPETTYNNITEAIADYD